MSRWQYEDETCPLQGFGNVVKTLLIAFLLAFLLCAVFGCSSIRYGDFAVDSLGTDVEIKSAEWHKCAGEESLIIKGAEKNGTESAHTAANIVMGILSALTGATVNNGDPLKGAAIGLIGGISLTEVWQTGKDLLK